MAAQDYNTISQPSLGVEANTLSLVVRKEDKKQKKELAHLAAVLATVKEELVSAKTGASLGGAASADAEVAEASGAGPSNTSIEDTLAKMAGALQLLQVEIAKYASSKAGSEGTISKAELKIAQDNLKKSNEQLKKLQQEINKQEHMSFWERLFEGILGVILTIVAAVTAQPELLIAAVLCFAGAAGLMQKATEGVAKLFDMIPGMPKEVANIIAGLIVTAVVILATAGMGAAAGIETAAASATNDATEIAEGAMEATEAGGEIAEEGTSTFEDIQSTASSILKKINIFRKFSARTNLMIQAAVQGSTSTGLINNIAGELTYVIAEKVDKKDAEKMKQEVEMIVGIIVAVMSLVASIGSSSAISEGAMSVAKTGNAAAGIGEEASVATRFMARFQDFGISAMGQRVFNLFRVGASLGQAGTGAAASVYEIEQGIIHKIMGALNADTVLDNSAISMNNAEMRGSQHFIAQREKQFKTSDRAILNVMKGEEAFAQLLTSSMV